MVEEKIILDEMWGLPILKTNLDSKLYNKKQIVKTIKQNYQKEQKRQEWSDSFYGTNIHHSNCDDDNINFLKPNYSELIPLYQEIIFHYFKYINLKKIKIDFRIVNYTASSHDSFMEPHLHSDCHFSMIHYIKFNQEQHQSTVFLNPFAFHEYWPGQNEINKNINKNLIKPSFVSREAKLHTIEDDIIIFPAILKHFVKNKKSNDLRIVISTNITII
tara:strand:+ start:44 stop:694 length:651 start_codon:yes stop_codon:yes gene_type:complete